MTDKIKEILEEVKFELKFEKWIEPLGFDKEHWKLLLDYITNLQQENERLKEDNLLIKSANKLVSDNLHIYKSKCEKAIPMLKELNAKLKKILNIGIDIKEISDIEKILEVGDDNE